VSLATNANQPFSNVAIRLEKLQNFCQVLTKNEPNQRISKVFTNLEKIDHHVIRTTDSCETIGRKHIVNKIAMKNAVERHMEALKKTATACIGYSSLTASRFHRLDNLSQAIVQVQAKIPALFQELHKDDRTRILKKFQKKTFDWNQMKEHKKLLLKEIEVMKAEHSFTIPSSKSLVNHLPKLPIPLMSSSVGSFLTEKERADLRSSCKDARKMQTPASSLIKNYKLEGLIETYLHVSSSALTPSDKAKTLHKLLSLAYSLSEIEELPRPTYSALPAFFQEVEARNLIRIIRAIRNARPLPHLPAEIEGLRIPKDPTKAMQKADRLRDWIYQYQDAIAAIDGILYLGNKDFSLLPKEIDQLKALRVLDLENNRLVSVPKEIGQLQALQWLYLTNNRLVSVPKEIGQLQALQGLDLGNNHLVSVPEEIGQLQALQELYLNQNCLVSVPKEIDQLKALQGLHLYNNRLVSVPKEIGQLKALQGLDLGNNHLVSVPEEIGQLQALHLLHLENNRLVSVPKEIGQLKALQELHLNNNHLVSIPKEIGQLKALKGLYLHNNRPVNVPKEIGQFQALKKLDSENNDPY